MQVDYGDVAGTDTGDDTRDDAGTLPDSKLGKEDVAGSSGEVDYGGEPEFGGPGSGDTDDL